eukprot:750632-Hanusia_phi.AAC.5
MEQGEGPNQEKEEGENNEEGDDDECYVSRYARAVRTKEPDMLYSDAVKEKLRKVDEGVELEEYEWKQIMAPQSGDFVPFICPLRSREQLGFGLQECRRLSRI